MGAWGAMIMGFFGSVFAALAVHRTWQVAGWRLALPFVAFAAIALGVARIARLPGRGIEPSERAGRVIMWSSIAEGVGLFIAANLVTNLGRPDLLLPAMALVVGLHFIPIGRATEFVPYYALAAALLAAALAGALVPAPVGGAIAGFAAAGALWTAAALALRRDWKAREAAA